LKAFIDASVIVAILKREAGHEELIKVLIEAGSRFYISPLVRFEATAALVKMEVDYIQQKTGKVTPDCRKKALETARKLVDVLVSEIEASDVMIDSRVGQGAIDAMAEYGRMVNHPAALNFGDCFSYACAKTNRLKLIYKGNDFSETDLV